MQFTYDGDLYKVIRITGPSHNLLGISFGESRNELLDIEVFKINGDDKEFILESSVKEQVLLGIKEVNEQLGTDYKIKKIQFIISDTPSDNIYKELVKELVKRIEDKGEFKRV